MLIQGETGTGKELVAKAIHNNSPRKNKPFVAINCTAPNENLLDDELFGHVPGPSPGPTRLRKGRFEEAHGGTLFLDEIGDMPLNLQAKLLKVLEDREVSRIGSNEPIRSTCASCRRPHRDLEAAVATREFRQDLYYRLNVLKIAAAAPVQRRRELPLLVTHFVRDFSTAFGKPVAQVADAVLRLKDYRWPGNVRELRNLIQGMVVLDTDGVLDLDDLHAADAEGRREPRRRRRGRRRWSVGRWRRSSAIHREDAGADAGQSRGGGQVARHRRADAVSSDPRLELAGSDSPCPGRGARRRRRGGEEPGTRAAALARKIKKLGLPAMAAD